MSVPNILLYLMDGLELIGKVIRGSIMDRREAITKGHEIENSRESLLYGHSAQRRCLARFGARKPVRSKVTDTKHE